LKANSTGHPGVDGRIALDEIDAESQLVAILGDGLLDVGNREYRLHSVELEGRQRASVDESLSG